MRRKMQESEITPLMRILTIYGQFPAFLHPEFLLGMGWAAVAVDLKAGIICCLLECQTTFLSIVLILFVFENGI